MFQTLPGLLTGFFQQVSQSEFDVAKRFKPFQGFLPVSSYEGLKTLAEQKIVSNPSRASYRFLPTNAGPWAGTRRLFQTLPGLLTGFFYKESNIMPPERKCFKPFQGFLPVSSKGWKENGRLMIMFQTLPGLLTGFFLVVSVSRQKN